MKFDVFCLLVITGIIGYAIRVMQEEYTKIKNEHRPQKTIDEYRRHMEKLEITDEKTLQEVIMGKSFDDIAELNKRLSKIKPYKDGS